MTRFILIGDIGGMRDELVALLEAQGVDCAKGVVPEGTIVVLVGDLIHRGPSSTGVIDLVERLRENSPGQIMVLFGNHESSEMGILPLQRFTNTIPETYQARLWEWFNSGFGRMAYSIRADGRDFLVTHAGLSPYLWDILGQPDAPTAAVMLNKMMKTNPVVTFQGGVLLGRPNQVAGVAFADAISEVYLPWARVALEGGQVPFGQVHGHCSLIRNGKPHFGPFKMDDERFVDTEFDFERSIVLTVIDGHEFWAIDPGHMKDPNPNWGPLILEGEATS